MSGIEARPRATADERRGLIVDGLCGVEPDAFGLLARFFAEGSSDLTARVAEDIRRPASAGVPPPADGTAREADEPWAPDPDLALASAWLDTLGLALDPLTSLAGIGWLVEHVRFLAAPLDWLAGDGDRIKDAVGRWRRAAVDLDRVAREEAGGATADDTRAASRRCAAVAEQLSTAGTITAAVRGMVRDLIGMFVSEVVRNAAVALAVAEASGGASVAAFTGWAVGRAAAVLERITGQVMRLLQALTRILDRLGALAGSL
ncbi:hypothetical protein [Saccharothrix sp. NRRL B-16314]|uniref:hypothetical protein n=1 Tax=Saccharothrix sp. NRRL B-16314 TaxID=1463825 RepID=UPI0005242FC4|nr:hypothetical protein [Saccharothrix sp. NRRL B-16314]